MSHTLTVDIVTPEEQLLSVETHMAVIPGQEGSFGVLPDHAPLISQVRPGAVFLFDKGSITHTIVGYGGIAEITGERCTLMASQAYICDENTLQKVKSEYETLKQGNDDPLSTQSLNALELIARDLEQKA